MVDELRGERAIALDLEAHSFRSFQGFTCLLQLSSRAADYVVDTLALRGALGPALAPLLADPNVVKVRCAALGAPGGWGAGGGAFMQKQFSACIGKLAL